MLSETIGDDNGDGGVVSEAEMTATHFDVLVERARRQQRRAPADDGVGSAVHRCGRDVCRWVAPTDQGTSERDDRAHRVGSTSGQLDGVDAAEAPSDQAHRAGLVRGGEQFIEAVGDVATEATVGAEAPSVAAVAKAINEPAQWRSRSIVAAQSGQHEHGVAVATARHRQQRTCSDRERGELGSRSSFPSHHRLPTRTLRHGITIPGRSSSNTSPAQPAAQQREDPAISDTAPERCPRLSATAWSTCDAAGVSSYTVRFEGPPTLALRVVTALADASGVELISSDQPLNLADGKAALNLAAEGAFDAVADAVATICGDLPSDDPFEITGT